MRAGFCSESTSEEERGKVLEGNCWEEIVTMGHRI